jgi:hypothetical protein
MNAVDAHTWSGNWAWGLPLIVLSLVIHVFGLLYIYVGIVGVLHGRLAHRRFIPMFAAVMGVSVLLVTILHAIEVEIWAFTYLLLGALPDHNTAMLYSLSSMTTYGHAALFLEAHWQLMGALEALNGVLLFGLTTAFLVAIIQKVLAPVRGEPRG